MSRTFEQIQDLVGRGEIRISEHGYDELAMDDIFVDAIFAGVAGGLVIEDYPNYPSATVPQPNRNISRKGAKAAKKTLCHFDQREKSFLDRRERK
jgi:hypothetical protein